MKLYYLQGACPLASQIAMEWMTQPYELHEVGRNELKSPEFLALNPVGSVPVLQHDGFTLTQSIAILEYLCELNPESGLLGNTPQERAETRRWLSFCNADLHRNFGLIFGAQAYAQSPDAQKELIENTSKRLQFLFGIVDEHLENKDWLAGSRSVADPYLYVLLLWSNFKNIDLSDKQNLKAFFDRMNADEGVQTALKKQKLA